MDEQSGAPPWAVGERGTTAGGTGGRRRPVRTVIVWTVMTVALVVFALALWVRFHFGSPGFEAVLTNLPVGRGWTVGNRALVREAFLVCLGIPVVIVLAAAAIRFLTWSRTEQRRILRHRGLLSGGALVVAIGVLLTVTGVPPYAVARISGQSFEPYYVAPYVASEPQHPRNLITIYLESMENSFRDAATFGENLLAPLDRATDGWTHVDQLQQYPGGGWTMAGIVSTQCGIPLRSDALNIGTDMNLAGQARSEYLPGATCLGDILAAHGWSNTFLGGADSDFAGKHTFLTDHGYTDVRGRDEWKKDGASPSLFSDWGLSDRALFDRARGALTELRASGQPYHLTVLTLDTHEAPGIFPSCQPDQEELAMATAIKCSMGAVGDFLDDLEADGVLDDTVVVVMGDHLKGTAGNSAYKAEMASFPDRTIVLAMSSPDPITIQRTARVDQFSMLPTILELLGFDVPDGRAGLGVSFVGDHSLADTALALPPDEYATLVQAPSISLYRALWSSAHS